MSCVLRVSRDGLDDCLLGIALKPYRVEGGTAHFDVSDCGFDNLTGQVGEAIRFLSVHAADIRQLMCASGASGVLDFAVERAGATFEFSALPANLVREAGALGLALEISHYPSSENRDAVA
jgi:hypothetical protein